MLGKGRETDGVRRDKLRIEQLLGADHVHQRQRQCTVGSRAQQQHLFGLGGGLGLAHVDGHDPCAARTGCIDEACGVGLTGKVGAPKQDQACVLAQVLLGVGLLHARKRQAEGTQSPADHGRIEELAAVEVRKAREQLRTDTRAVIGRECAMPGPDRRGLRRMGGECRRDAFQGFVPCGPAERVFTPIAYQWVEQAPGIVEHLARGLASNTQKAATVRVVRVAPHDDDLVLLDLDDHSAQRWMAAHGTHRACRRHQGLLEVWLAGWVCPDAA